MKNPRERRALFLSVTSYKCNAFSIDGWVPIKDLKKKKKKKKKGQQSRYRRYCVSRF